MNLLKYILFLPHAYCYLFRNAKVQYIFTKNDRQK